MRHYTHIFLAFGLCVSLTTGCSKSSQEPQALEPVAAVTLVDVGVGNLPLLTHSYGAIEFDPSGQHTLTTDIEARVVELKTLPGARVAEGDVILRLGLSSASSLQLAQARRNAQAAQAALARARRLRTDGLASDADVETAQASADDMTALADSLEQRLGAVSNLPAPISGIVTELLVEPGQLVVPGSQLARLSSPDALRARMRVEVEDAAALENGDPVHLTALDRTGAEMETMISSIDLRVDSATRMATVFATVLAGHGLLPGEAIRAEITRAMLRGVVLVPRASVFTDEKGNYVFVASKEKAELRRVTTGATTGDFTQIRNGLSDGEKIVLEGAAILSDGMKIRLQDTAQGEGR